MSKIKAVLAGIGALLAILAGVFTFGRRSGRARERTDQLKDELEESEANSEIFRKQGEAAADRPRGSDDLDDRMSDRSF